ncbi:MAG TPA: hypothetical protein VKB76_12900, partial [Ktedonobacterales bacterium]|nr:hypothetical protein [Ktedonobacterales bacterium]
MTSVRAVTFGNAGGPSRERGLDLYETPAVAVEAQLEAETLPKVIWAPCCGHGAIADVPRGAGHDVTATDLDLDCIDFLLVRNAPAGAEAIVTNPPYRLAAEFVRHGPHPGAQGCDAAAPDLPGVERSRRHSRARLGPSAHP